MSTFTQSRRGVLRGTMVAGVGLFGASGIARQAAAQGMTTLRVRLVDDISVLDPGYMVGAEDIDVLNAVMSRLADYDFSGDVMSWKPSAITESLSMRDDGLHIDFALKPGFMWTNGFGELTAEDVKYSFERLPDSDWGGPWASLDRVDVTDTYSGTIVLSQRFAPIWLEAIAGSTGVILCKAAMEQLPDERITTEIPATCGPYLFEWEPKQRITYVPNPDWAGPKPDFERIEAVLVDEDQAGELAYEAGELDMTKLSAPAIVRYTADPPDDTVVRIAGAQQYMWLGMNTDHPKLADINVRKALQHAVDVDQVIAGAYEGVTERAYGIVPPGLPGKRNEVNYSFNPAKAREMLEAAGVSGLQLTLRTLNNQQRVLASQIIQANMAEAGVTVTVEPVDSGVFWEMGSEEAGDQWQDLEIWLMRFGGGMDPYEPFQWFRADQVGVWNWERWTSEEYEELYEAALTANSVEERVAMYLRMQEIMEETGAYVFINHEPEAFAHRTFFEPEVWPDGQVNFSNFTAV